MLLDDAQRIIRETKLVADGGHKGLKIGYLRIVLATRLMFAAVSANSFLTQSFGEN